MSQKELGPSAATSNSAALLPLTAGSVASGSCGAGVSRSMLAVAVGGGASSDALGGCTYWYEQMVPVHCARCVAWPHVLHVVRHSQAALIETVSGYWLSTSPNRSHAAPSLTLQPPSARRTSVRTALSPLSCCSSTREPGAASSGTPATRCACSSHAVA